MLTMDMIQDARRVLDGVARLTPLYQAPAIGENIYIKAENLQMTGAFKLGARTTRSAA
jgi:threonine dehydratase